MIANKLEQAKELMCLCADINGTEERKAGNGPCIFVDLSGHIATLGIRIILNGWDEWRSEDLRFCFYLDDKDYGDSYEKIRDSLQAIKKCAGSGNSEVAHDK